MARGTALVTAAIGGALLAAAPSPEQAISALAVAPGAADPMAPLLAVVALAAWSLLTWLLVVAAATSGAARLPGLAGRVSDLLASRLAPAGVRRLVEICLGLTVAVGAAGATPAAAGTQPPPPRAATGAASLDWPIPATPIPATPIPATPIPQSPAGPALDWNPATPETAEQAVAVVQPGDSLWAIAADHLGPGASDAQIARAWPAWWSANRDAVGPDPDLIHPGLRLTPPAQS